MSYNGNNKKGIALFTPSQKTYINELLIKGEVDISFKFDMNIYLFTRPETSPTIKASTSLAVTLLKSP